MFYAVGSVSPAPFHQEHITPPQPVSSHTRSTVDGSQQEYPEEKGILAPGAPENRENETERNQRLQDAGVIPTPPPAVPALSRLEKDMTKLSEQGTTTQGKLAASLARFEMNVGSWWAPVSPTGTKYMRNSSHGTAVLVRVTPPVDIGRHQWSLSQFTGIEGVFFNGGAYVKTHDEWSGTSDVYADTNASEIGWTHAFIWEQQGTTNTNVGFDLRASYLPLRFIRAKSYSSLPPPKNSEARTGFIFNWAGLGASAALSWNFARLLEFSVFCSMNLGTPWQVRNRAGIRISMMLLEGEEKKP